MFQSLPNSRNFDSLVTLVPGVTNESRLGGSSVDGASGLENMYYIDGMNTNDLKQGTSKQQVVYEFVQEVQVTSSGYQAEYGGSLGGVVSVITRSGGNNFHGGLNMYYSGSALNGKERNTLRLNPFDSTKAEYVNYQDLYSKDQTNIWEAGFQLGGYVVKDKLWFFLAASPNFPDTTRNIKWLTGSTPSGTYSQKYKYYNFSGKISAMPFEGLRLAASFVSNTSSYTGALPTRDGSGNAAYPYDKAGFTYPNYSGALTADLVLGNDLLINGRFGYFMINTANQKLQPTGILYTFGVGTNAQYQDLVSQYPDYIKPLGYSAYPSTYLNVTKDNFFSRANASGDLTYYFSFGGEHSFKAGFQWVRQYAQINVSPGYDSIAFQWGQNHRIIGQEQNPFMGKYGVYQVFYANPPLGPNTGQFGKTATNNLSFYLQDSWTPIKKLTVNFGLRAERESIPSFSSNPKYAGNVMTWDFGDKLAPRLGAVYDVFGDSSLKIFGSFGLFFDVLKMQVATANYGLSQNVVNWYTLDDPRWWTYGENGNYPGTFIERFDWYSAGGSFNTTDKSMKPMSQTEFSFGAEKKISEDISVSARFVRKHLLWVIEDIGIPTPGGFLYWIANPGRGASLNSLHGGQFPANLPDTPRAKREYAAVNFALEKRFSNNWTAGFSYTWSQLWGNYSGLANSAASQLAPNINENYDFWYQEFDKHMNVYSGRLWTDRPHVFKLYGSYAFKNGLTLGFFSNAMSGVPVSRKVYIPQPYWPEGLFTDGRTPFQWTTDLFVQYGLRLGKTSVNINLNVTNLFNAANAQTIFDRVNRTSITTVTEAMLLSGTFDYKTQPYAPDPRFLMPYNFLGPISGRLGLSVQF